MRCKRCQTTSGQPSLPASGKNTFGPSGRRAEKLHVSAFAGGSAAAWADPHPSGLSPPGASSRPANGPPPCLPHRPHPDSTYASPGGQTWAPDRPRPRVSFPSGRSALPRAFPSGGRLRQLLPPSPAKKEPRGDHPRAPPNGRAPHPRHQAHSRITNQASGITGVPAFHRTRCTFTNSSTVSCNRTETANVLTTPLLYVTSNTNV